MYCPARSVHGKQRNGAYTLAPVYALGVQGVKAQVVQSSRAYLRGSVFYFGSRLRQDVASRAATWMSQVSEGNAYRSRGEAIRFCVRSAAPPVNLSEILQIQCSAYVKVDNRDDFKYHSWHGQIFAGE